MAINLSGGGLTTSATAKLSSSKPRMSEDDELFINGAAMSLSLRIKISLMGLIIEIINTSRKKILKRVVLKEFTVYVV